jgi:hypothetical protein
LGERYRLVKTRVSAFNSSRRIDNIKQESTGGVTQNGVVVKRAPGAAQGGNDTVPALVQ